MFAYIEGRVTEKHADAMVVEAGGVGFLVSATPQTISSVSGSGARCRVYTKVVAKKDDVWEIYGFATREEREMFEKLTSVSGVGPKMALGVLSALPVRDLALAIVAGDAKALKAAPGIGAKTAQRLLLELRDKVSDEELVGDFAAGGAAVNAAGDGGSIQFHIVGGGGREGIVFCRVGVFRVFPRDQPAVCICRQSAVVGGDAVAVRLKPDGKFLLAAVCQDLAFMFGPAAGQRGGGNGRCGDLHGIVISRAAEIQRSGYGGGTAARFGVLQNNAVVLRQGLYGIPADGVLILLYERVGNMRTENIALCLGIRNKCAVTRCLHAVALRPVYIAGCGGIVL